MAGADRSKETRNVTSHNMGETVGGDGRGGYRSKTIHYYSHNSCDHGRLLFIPGSSSHVDDSIHENERGDSTGDGSIRGIRYQDIRHNSFSNNGESVDGDGISGYRYQTSPSHSHH